MKKSEERKATKEEKKAKAIQDKDDDGDTTAQED
jgi:hypothetical protein